MDDLSKLASGLGRLEALTGGNKKKASKRYSREQILSILATEYGYQAYVDARDNKMMAKDLLALLDQVKKNRYNKMIDLAYATRLSQAEKRDFDKIIKQWNKEVE